MSSNDDESNSSEGTTIGIIMGILFAIFIVGVLRKNYRPPYSLKRR